MQKCGEAAAAMAYLSLREQKSLQELPYTQLKALLQAGSCLAESHNRMVFWGTRNGKTNAAFTWPEDIDAIQAELRSEQPGIAMWSCRCLGAPIVPYLLRWLEDADETLRKHSALALGLLGHPAALAPLRQMAAEPDCYTPKTSRKYNMYRGVSAVYLLGKLEDAGSVDLLLPILESDSMFATLPLQADEFIANRGERYFQFFSFTLMSLIRIGNKHPHTRPALLGVFKTIRQNLPPLSITLKNVPHRSFPMNPTIETVFSETILRWEDAER